VAKWYEVSGRSADKVRTAFKVARRNFQVHQSIEGVSFYVRVPDDNAPAFQRLLKEFELESKEVVGDSLPRAILEKRTIQGSDQTPVVPKKSTKIKKEMPPKEQLLSLARQNTVEQVAKCYQTSTHTVRKWLSTIPEAKNLQRTYTCPEPGCGKKFTGQWAKQWYANHLRQVHKYRHEKPTRAPKTIVDREVPTEALPLKEKIDSFNREIVRLEAEKAKVVKGLDQKIAVVKTAKEQYANSILAILTGEGR
jgi:hypothetical protein